MKLLTFTALLAIQGTSCNMPIPDQAVGQPPAGHFVQGEVGNSAEITSSLAGTYQFTYPHNTASLNEDHFIVLYEHQEVLHGTYFGTSDDFDPAREGYKPGYYYAEMQDLQINDSIISFYVEVTDSTIYMNQITPFVKTAEQRPWQHKVQRYKQAFQGTLRHNTINIPVDHFVERLFVKIED